MGHDALTHDLLAWIAARPRTYEETLDAWKTSCPRLAIWDDAIADGLARVGVTPGRGRTVVLSESGRALLAALESSSRPFPVSSPAV